MCIHFCDFTACIKLYNKYCLYKKAQTVTFDDDFSELEALLLPNTRKWSTDNFLGT